MILQQPATKVNVAFLLGCSDAESGDAFAPETYFVQPAHKIQYTLGFELVRGENEITLAFKKHLEVA